MAGQSLLDLAAGKSNGRDTIQGEVFEHDIPDIDSAEPGLVFRWCIQSDWKLIQSADGKVRELYNLKTDPREEKDLASAEPERVKRLAAILKPW